jgi:uncharacterized protein (TIRG00374 family)
MKKYSIRLFISLSVLLLLLYWADLDALLNSFRSISFSAVMYAFVLILVIRVVMAVRWKVLLNYYQIKASLTKLVEIMFVSNAIGHLLPSGVGADIIRVYELSKHKGSSEKVLASVFLDRVFGLISMLLVALLAAWYAYFSGQLGWMIPLLVSSAVLMFPVVFFITRFLLTKNISLQSSNKLLVKISGFYNRFIFALRETDIPAYGFYILILLSVLVQFIRCLVFMFIFIGLGSDIAIVHYFIFIPIVFILMLVPISIGGLGVRESALFAFFGPLGQSLATCTVSGLVFHALQLVMIIPGLIIFILRK